MYAESYTTWEDSTEKQWELSPNWSVSLTQVLSKYQQRFYWCRWACNKTHLSRPQKSSSHLGKEEWSGRDHSSTVEDLLCIYVNQHHVVLTGLTQRSEINLHQYCQPMLSKDAMQLSKGMTGFWANGITAAGHPWTTNLNMPITPYTKLTHSGSWPFIAGAKLWSLRKKS